MGGGPVAGPRGARVSPPPPCGLLPPTTAHHRPGRRPGRAVCRPRSPRLVSGQLLSLPRLGTTEANLIMRRMCNKAASYPQITPRRPGGRPRGLAVARCGVLRPGRGTPPQPRECGPLPPPLTAPRQPDRPAARSARPGRRGPRPGHRRRPGKPRPVLTWCLFLRGSGKMPRPDAPENRSKILFLWGFLVEPRGVEPLTSSLRTMRSTN